MTITPATPVIGQPLVLTCKNGQRNYQLFKDHDLDNVISTSETYTIPALALSDAGQWFCSAEGNWRGVAISFPLVLPSTGEYSEETQHNKYLLSIRFSCSFFKNEYTSNRLFRFTLTQINSRL